MRVLEVNVDDVGLGGVYALVSSVILSRPEGVSMDIACIARFESPAHVAALNACGCEIHYIGTDGGKLSRPRAYYTNLRRLLRERRYDCVHIHGDVAYLMLIFARAARDAGVEKIVLHSHAAGIDGGSRRVKLALHTLTKRFLPRYATRLAACSDRAAEWLYSAEAADRAELVRNGIDVERFAWNPMVRAEERARLGLKDAYVVGHVGRFAHQKNHAFLLRAFAEIHRRIPEARLLLVGEGVLMETIREQAEMLGIGEGVLFHGPSDHVERLLQAKGITGFGRIFVSSRYGLCKRDGLLGLLPRELGLAPGEILHIGDSPENDGLPAGRAGIRFFRIPPARRTEGSRVWRRIS